MLYKQMLVLKLEAMVNRTGIGISLHMKSGGGGEGGDGGGGNEGGNIGGGNGEGDGGGEGGENGKGEGRGMIAVYVSGDSESPIAALRDHVKVFCKSYILSSLAS